MAGKRWSIESEDQKHGGTFHTVRDGDGNSRGVFADIKQAKRAADLHDPSSPTRLTELPGGSHSSGPLSPTPQEMVDALKGAQKQMLGEENARNAMAQRTKKSSKPGDDK